MVSDRRLPVGFWLAIGVGIVLRVWYFADLAQQPWFGYPLVDSLTFDRTARKILAQGHPAAYFRPPLYPYFLAGLYAVVGRNFAVVAAVQGLLGLAALYPAYRLGERWFGRAAALGEFSEAWHNLGVVAERRGAAYSPLTAEYYRRALAVNPAYAPALANLEALERGEAAATGARAGDEPAVGAAGSSAP